MPQIVIANVPLISWLWFLDALVASLVALWLIIRIFFFLLDRIALRCPGCLPVYLTITPYEFAILFLIWCTLSHSNFFQFSFCLFDMFLRSSFVYCAAVIVLAFYPIILVGLIEDSVVDDTIWAACW
jgi:hypothetical protein